MMEGIFSEEIGDVRVFCLHMAFIEQGEVRQRPFRNVGNHASGPR